MSVELDSSWRMSDRINQLEERVIAAETALCALAQAIMSGMPEYSKAAIYEALNDWAEAKRLVSKQGK